MRIDKIVLNNYRQFRDVEIDFSNKTSKDLHYILGQNGTGKTNLLNAISWCLYNSEPHLSNDSQQLPRLNLTMHDRVDEICSLKVEVWVTTYDGTRIIFSRTEDYVTKGKGFEPQFKCQLFKVKVTDNNGNTKIYEKDDDTTTFVERFIPQGIREFFFFDGERLDNYFKEATGQGIKHAIFEISQIDILERIERNLRTIIDELRREAGKLSPEVDEIRKKLEQKEKEHEEVQKHIGDIQQQIDMAKKKIDYYSEALRGLPDIEKLEEQRRTLEIKKKRKVDILKEKKEEKNKLLFNYGVRFMLVPAIFKARDVIKDKKMKKEIPPIMDKDLLEKVIKLKRCEICGRDIKPNSIEEERVKDLIEKISFSSVIAKELNNMEQPLNLIYNDLRQFKDIVTKITKEIQDVEKDLEEIVKQIQDIDKQIGGYDKEKIKDWNYERKKFQTLYEEALKKLGEYQKLKQDLESEINENQNKLKKEMHKENKLKDLEQHINFSTDALNVIKESKERIMDLFRQKIANETKSLFFELIWKKETFKDVDIDDGYNLHLIHAKGYECLGTVSAAERELLALAFTIALHKISGFDSCIIIDTPVARISDNHRENFAKVFLRLSNEKQVILLVTPDEYSDEMRKILENEASNKYKFKLEPNEEEVLLEEVK
jgi:DNA sulfur modification protein DndD